MQVHPFVYGTLWGLVILLALGLLLTWLLSRRAVRNARQFGWVEGNYEAKQKAVEVAARTRWEVVVYEQPHMPGDMRWRWEVYDANFRLIVWLGLGEVTDPVMLGNAATRAMAEAEMMAWIADRPRYHPHSGQPQHSRFTYEPLLDSPVPPPVSDKIGHPVPAPSREGYDPVEHGFEQHPEGGWTREGP